MRTHWRVDSASGARFPLYDTIVEFLTHAVQTLEFEGARGLARQREHIGNRVRVVGRELRKNLRYGCGQQKSCARQIADIGIGLASEHRITRQSALLRALDLAVPIRALDQPDIQPPAA